VAVDNRTDERTEKVEQGVYIHKRVLDPRQLASRSSAVADTMSVVVYRGPEALYTSNESRAGSIGPGKRWS
jgi:hypothetical protein